jgi:hypothetical protein
MSSEPRHPLALTCSSYGPLNPFVIYLVIKERYDS